MPEDRAIVRQQVKIVPKEEGATGDLSPVVHYHCGFCGKKVIAYPVVRKVCERLSGSEFYCSFCLRNGFNNKDNIHVLPLSFRAITGFYYFEKYLNVHSRQMWISEINDFMKSHENVGLLNPVFSYDPDSFLWFIDFSKIGRGPKKIRLAEVQKTIINILVCFNLREHVPHVRMVKLQDKYMIALQKFYTNRFRPEGKRALIPTLAGCGPHDNKKFDLDMTRDFTPEHLITR